MTWFNIAIVKRPDRCRNQVDTRILTAEINLILSAQSTTQEFELNRASSRIQKSAQKIHLKFSIHSPRIDNINFSPEGFILVTWHASNR